MNTNFFANGQVNPNSTMAHSLRPFEADLSQAVDRLFRIDTTFTKPILHKDQLYSILQCWSRLQRPRLEWVWSMTTADPLGQELARRLPQHLTENLSVKIHTEHRLNDVGKRVQVKRWAYRFTRLSPIALHVWRSLRTTENLHLMPARPRLRDFLKSDTLRQLRPSTSSGTLTMPDETPQEDVLMLEAHRHESLATLLENNASVELQETSSQPPRSEALRGGIRCLNTSGANPHDTAVTHPRSTKDKDVVHILELYALSAPACRYAHAGHVASIVRTLAVDWNEPSPVLVASAKSDHQHIRFNLNCLSIRDITVWARTKWGIEVSRIDWVHCSFDCTTQSLASASKAVHRNSAGAPTSWDAHQSDKTIAATLHILAQLVDKAPRMLCTVEQPRHSVFTSHPSVRQLTTMGLWQLLQSSHCKAADPILDGPVTNDSQCPGLFPQKDTIWLVSGLPPRSSLSKCKMDCDMLTPDGSVHRLLISMPSAHPLKPGQHVIRQVGHKGRIPLGIMHELWEQHQQVRFLPDSADYECATCGKEHSTRSDPLLICEGGNSRYRCTRVQHKTCAGLSTLDKIPDNFICSTCSASMEMGAELAMLG